MPALLPRGVYPKDPSRANRVWNVEVTPVSKEDISIGLGPGPACDAAGAMCTADGRALANAIGKTVLGPPGLSVADATVREAEGAVLEFAVTLSRASVSTVTVDYATSDGSATAGSDYTSRSGTLTFAPDETSKTVSVQQRLAALSDWLQGGSGEGPEAGSRDGRRAGVGSRPVTVRDLLTGSSFALTGEASAGGTVSLWGRGAVSRFDGREGELSLEGEVTSAMLGADWSRSPDGSGSGTGAWTAGLLVAHSEGSGSYRGDGAPGSGSGTTCVARGVSLQFIAESEIRTLGVARRRAVPRFMDS